MKGQSQWNGICPTMISQHFSKVMNKILTALALLSTMVLQAQVVKTDTSDLTFTGTRISQYSIDYDSTGHFTLSGYIDAYYSYYSDTSLSSGYQKFPTAAPRSNQFGLNIAQLSAKYQSRRFRGLTTFFFGDTPSSAWSPNFNMIQEAHLGFRIVSKLWMDAGFFRTHIGLESIQPRENIAMSFATTTYFEPYYMSGAKLTWEHSEKLLLQLNVFNGFNNFVDNNENKAIGASATFSPNEKLNLTFSTLLSDESDDDFPRDQMRLYNNLIGVFQTKHVTIGLEMNYGIQQNSVLTDTTATASIFSSLLAAKFRITPEWGVYGRGEFYSDPNEILTGPVVNENHQLIGLDIVGGTIGIEYKPIPNSYFRIEGRVLQTQGTDEHIFYLSNNPSNTRYEIITGIGVWF